MKFHLILAIVFVVMTLSVNADIFLASPEDSAFSSIKGQHFSFSITETPSYCNLNINNVSVKSKEGITANTSTTFTHDISDGKYHWSVSCVTSTSTINSSKRSIVIDTTPPAVTLISPASKSTIRTNKINLSYNPVDENLVSCTLRVKIGGTWKSLKTDASPVPNQPNFFKTDLIDDSYKWNIECTDKVSNSGSAVFDSELTLDTTPPKITGFTPFTVITESSATLTVTTDESATCRFSKSSNLSFSAMTEFELTELTSHRQFLVEVSDGINTYYVRCVDILGNEMDQQKIKLDVHLLPTAKISLSRDSPVSAGRIDVEVKTSRNLIAPPELSYTLNTEDPVSVALTGSETAWKGSIIIEPIPKKKLGKFTFRGTDVSGYAGTIITNGKTFIVDTDIPEAPANVRGELRSGIPFISWYSADDDIKYHQVFRSTKAGVSYADYYENTSSEQFLDLAAANKQTYYYKFASIDSAGNRGTLSTEIFLTAATNISKEEPVKQQKEEVKPLPPNLVIKVNDAIKTLESHYLSIEQAKKQLEALPSDRKSIENELDLLGKVTSAKSKLDSLISDLTKLQQEYQTDQTVESHTVKADLESKKVLSTLASNLEIEEQTEFVEQIGKEDILRGTNELASILGINPDNKDDYVKKNLDITKDIKISTKVSLLNIRMLSGDINKKTLIQKSLSYKGEQPLEDVIVLEFIPKTVAESTKEMTFISGIPEIINDDPIIKWGFFKLGFDAQPIKYVIDREVSFNYVKDSRTVPLTRLSDLSESQNEVTGFITQNISKGSSITAAIVMITLLLLAFYYFKPVQKSGEQVRDPVSYDLLTDINRKLTSVKFEIDDVMNPLMSKINRSLTDQSNLSGIELAQNIIGVANYYINSNQRAEAKHLYDTIALIYQNLTKEQKAQISKQCHMLRNRLQQ